MGEFRKGPGTATEDPPEGQWEKSEKSAFQLIGDDKGEGGQKDIKADRLEGDPGTPQQLDEGEPTGESKEGKERAPTGGGREQTQRQQGDEDLDADREPGQAPQ